MSCEADGSCKRTGPACDDCGASAETDERWNTRDWAPENLAVAAPVLPSEVRSEEPDHWQARPPHSDWRMIAPEHVDYYRAKDWGVRRSTDVAQSPDQIEITRLSGLLAEAQKIIAEYKASTIAAAREGLAQEAKHCGEPVAWIVKWTRIVKWTTVHTPKNASAYLNEKDAQRAAANVKMYADASDVVVIPTYAAQPTIPNILVDSRGNDIYTPEEIGTSSLPSADREGGK